MMLTPDDIRDIVAVLDSTALDHFHVETGSMSLTLWRDGDGHGWSARTVVTREPNRVGASPHATAAAGPDPGPGAEWSPGLPCPPRTRPPSTYTPSPRRY
ncbi:hypothetical protein ACRAWF_30435 [Streptomyces sp. L7]